MGKKIAEILGMQSTKEKLKGSKNSNYFFLVINYNKFKESSDAGLDVYAVGQRLITRLNTLGTW